MASIADGFYKGEIARAIVAKSKALGGTMTLEDLANYHGEWVEPAHTRYHALPRLRYPRAAAAFAAWAAGEMLRTRP
jgi:gamma-glutamyltranspeptidase / glutathione hydrolase